MRWDGDAQRPRSDALLDFSRPIGLLFGGPRKTQETGSRITPLLFPWKWVSSPFSPPTEQDLTRRGQLATGIRATLLPPFPTHCNVRFGSKADMCSANSHVRFTPNSGHVQCTTSCPLCANSGHGGICRQRIFLLRCINVDPSRGFRPAGIALNQCRKHANG